MRTLGEPAGGRRLTDEQNTVDEAEQTGRPSTRRLQPPAPSSLSEDGAADERTSPFPYAEKFDEWVADETATPDARQRRGWAGDADE